MSCDYTIQPIPPITSEVRGLNTTWKYTYTHRHLRGEAVLIYNVFAYTIHYYRILIIIINILNPYMDAIH